MPEIETTGYKKYWELKQLVGHNSDGSKKTVEGFRDMTNGEFHIPKEGWSGEPPELPPGEREPTVSNSDNYGRNYETTFGHS